MAYGFREVRVRLHFRDLVPQRAVRRPASDLGTVLRWCGTVPVHLILPRSRDRLFRSPMGGLFQLFYPWGILLQLAAFIHFMRRRPDGYWLWVILIGGGLGALAYIVMEIVPDVGLLGTMFQGFGRRSRIEQMELTIIDNPSAGNYEDLGELCWDQKQYAKAREAFDRAIAARSDSAHSFYRRALCALALGDVPAAIPDLEHVVRGDPKFDYYRAPALLADAYARNGQTDLAAPLFAHVIEQSSMPETLFNYASFLKATGRPAEAREWLEKLMLKKRTMPRYVERRERPWFRKGEDLLKELARA